MGVRMPSRQTVSIGKEAMKKLRHFCVDTEVRPDDVVEAMILREDFEKNGENLLVLIKNNQRNDVGGAVMRFVLRTGLSRAFLRGIQSFVVLRASSCILRAIFVLGENRNRARDDHETTTKEGTITEFRAPSCSREGGPVCLAS
jgi:hypothetical protein